jgi:dephospho-CoA kinase
MIKIGLTGSIAMGKSEVVKVLQGQGLPVFDADDEVHQLYDSPEGIKLLSTIVPDAIRNGKLDRNLLSSIVVADPQKLNALEKLVHAEIAKRRQSFVEKADIEGHNLVVFDIPLLFEKQLDKTVDVTVVVSAPEPLQRQRALARPGMTAQKLDMILSRQMPDVKKRQCADYVIENDGTLTDLAHKTLNVLDNIKRTHHL